MATGESEKSSLSTQFLDEIVETGEKREIATESRQVRNPDGVSNRFFADRQLIEIKIDQFFRMSSHEVQEYLSKIYKLPVCEVQTKVEPGECQWSNAYLSIFMPR